MAGESAQDAGHEQTEALIDEAIRAILNEATAESPGHGKASAGSLLETAAIASRLTSSRSSLLERLLVAEVLGSALADALAPALADQLASRLLKYMEDAAATKSSREPSGKGQASTASSGGLSRGRLRSGPGNGRGHWSLP